MIQALLLVLSLSCTAQAGNMKDLLIDHEESIIHFLFALGFEVKGISDSRFTTPDKGYDVAIDSVVEVYSPSIKDFDMMNCISQFTGNAQDGFQHAAIYCN
jgi:hypothetical protein